jgi:hypothetical protein
MSVLREFKQPRQLYTPSSWIHAWPGDVLKLVKTAADVSMILVNAGGASFFPYLVRVGMIVMIFSTTVRYSGFLMDTPSSPPYLIY